MNYREQARVDLRKWSRTVFYDCVQDCLERYPEMGFDEAELLVEHIMDDMARAQFARSASGSRT